MKNYLEKLTEKGWTINKSFWKFMKPFLTNKGFIGNNDVTLIHKNKIISNENNWQNCLIVIIQILLERAEKLN